MQPRQDTYYQMTSNADVVYAAPTVLDEFKKLTKQKDKEQFLKAVSLLLLQSNSSHTYYVAKIKKEKLASGEEGYAVIFLNQSSASPPYLKRSFTISQLAAMHENQHFKSMHVSRAEKFSAEVQAKLAGLARVREAYEADVYKAAVATSRRRADQAERREERHQAQEAKEAEKRQQATLQAEQAALAAAVSVRKGYVAQATQEKQAKLAAIEKERAAKAAQVLAERAAVREQLLRVESKGEKDQREAVEKRFALEDDPFRRATADYQQKYIAVEGAIAEIERAHAEKMQHLLSAVSSTELSARVVAAEAKLRVHIKEAKASLEDNLAEDAKIIVKLTEKDERILAQAQQDFDQVCKTALRAALQEAISHYSKTLSATQKEAFLADAKAKGLQNIFIKDPMQGQIIINPEFLAEDLDQLRKTRIAITDRFAHHAFAEVLHQKLRAQEQTIVKDEKAHQQEKIATTREGAARVVAARTQQNVSVYLEIYKSVLQDQAELYATEKNNLLEIEKYRAAVKAAPVAVDDLVKKHSGSKKEATDWLQSMKSSKQENPPGSQLSAALERLTAAEEKLTALQQEIAEKSAAASKQLASSTIPVGEAYAQAEMLDQLTLQAKEQALIIEQAHTSIKNEYLTHLARKSSQIMLAGRMQAQERVPSPMKPHEELYKLVDEMLEQQLPFWDKQALTSSGSERLTFLDNRGKEKNATVPTGVSQMILKLRAAKNDNKFATLKALGEIAQERIQRKGFLKPVTRRNETKEFYNILTGLKTLDLQDPKAVAIFMEKLRSSKAYQQQQALAAKKMRK